MRAKHIGLIAAGLLWAVTAFGYSGSGMVVAMKPNDFKIRYFNGTQAGTDSALLYCTPAGIVTMGAGNYSRTIPLKIPNAVILQGQGRTVTVIEAAAGFTGTALIMNADTTGAQQWCAVENLTVDGHSELGRTVARGILMKSVGQPSRIRDVTVQQVSGVGIWREGGATNAGNFVIENSGVAHTGHHCVDVTGYSGMTGIYDLDTEDPGPGSAGLMLDGATAGFFPSAIFIHGFHVELLSAGEIGLQIDDAQGISADGVAYYGSGGTGDLIKITGTSANAKNITIANVVAVGGALANTINDTVYGRVYSGGQNVSFYCTNGIEAALVTSGLGGTGTNGADIVVNSGNSGSTQSRVAIQRNGQIDWLALGNGTLEQIQVRHGLIFGTTAGGGLGFADITGKWRFGDTSTPTETVEIGGAGKMKLGSTTFGSLGTPANGATIYCSDCTIANPCAGSGTGAFAKRINGTWICN